MNGRYVENIDVLGYSCQATDRKRETPTTKFAENENS